MSQVTDDTEKQTKSVVSYDEIVVGRNSLFVLVLHEEERNLRAT